MKAVVLCALLVLGGCAVSIGERSTVQPVRWKQALLDNGTSPQCLSLIKSTTCKEFAESNRRLYQTLENAHLELMSPQEQTFIRGMKQDIIHDLRVLVNYPECEVKP